MKRGQVTIFVILAILIVVAVAVFFLFFRGGRIDAGLGHEFTPESFLGTCVRESALDKINTLLPQGGFLNPGNYKIYNNVRATYLCHNINFYESCIMQYPLYVTSIQEELESGIREDVESCFLELEDELERRNYDVSADGLDINVILKPEVVEIEIYREMQLSKESIRDIDTWNVLIKSPLYDLASVANEIATQEAKYCYFEYVGYMLLYPKYDIRKTTLSDSTKIYSITHKPSGETMNIAIRGCAIPAGF